VTDKRFPRRGKIRSGSPWAPISFSPATFQLRLGCPTDSQGHQALRYRSVIILLLPDENCKHFLEFCMASSSQPDLIREERGEYRLTP